LLEREGSGQRNSRNINTMKAALHVKDVELELSEESNSWCMNGANGGNSRQATTLIYMSTSYDRGA